MDDRKVLAHIHELIDCEEQLYLRGNLKKAEMKKIQRMKIERDRCWDLLRQRRALREAGKDPEDAHIRSRRVVENYKQ